MEAHKRFSHGGHSSARPNQVHNLIQVPLGRSVGEGQKGSEYKVTPASFQRKLRRGKNGGSRRNTLVL